MRKLKTPAIDVLTKISSLPNETLNLINKVKLLQDNCNSYYTNWYSRLLRGIFLEVMYPEEMKQIGCYGIIEEALKIDDLHFPEKVFLNTTMLYSKLFDLKAFEHIYAIPNNYYI